ncbi:MAG: zinc metallopeptidase, partial [Verrucomicrobiota bacterium]
MILDSYWYFIIPGLLLGIYAQIKLSSAYNRYKRVGIASGLSGAEAAQEILSRAGLGNVPVQEVRGHLTDHYDPTRRALFLSSENFHGRSLAAVGVAAHEAGHALQHQAAYAPLNLRMALVPITQFASKAWVGIILLGWILGAAVFYKFNWIAHGNFTLHTFLHQVKFAGEIDSTPPAKETMLKRG